MLTATDPRTGRSLPQIAETTAAEFDDVLDAAVSAAHDPSFLDAGRRADMLRIAAARLRDRKVDILAAAERETGLPSGRLGGELERTCVQLEMLGEVARRGEHLEVIIDRADPDAQPIPRPDVRRMLIGLGPVAVFGASNFPLAFSTAGGDTASALAAGCPVVVKGHPAHPQTGLIVAAVLAEAGRVAGLPAGAFGHVLAGGYELGEQLVDDDRIEAVAFTGSLRGGKAIAARAAARPRPIPVYAEMGSLNPVIITEAALQTRGEEIADGLVASVATFGGQLCTKPGVVLAPTGAAGDALCSALARRLADRAPEVLLTSAIAAGFAHGLTALQEVAGVERLTPPHESAQAGFRAAPALFRASLSALHEHVSLREEHFGPAVIVFGYGGEGELRDALTGLGGQLSAAVHAEPRDYDGLAWLVDLCARCAGRVVFNGYPTGVSVCWAMQHGGPYPASSQAGHTSVGMTATRRFLRPVAFQNAPAELLPLALRDGNPLGLWRRVNGKLTGSAAGQTELDRRPGVPRRSAAPPVAR